MFLISILVVGHLLGPCYAKVITYGEKLENNDWRRYHTPTREMKSFNVDIKDKIIELQCYARCENNLTHSIGDVTQENCQNVCQEELLRSPRRGICPLMTKSDMFRNIVTRQRFPCLGDCAYDHDCPDVQRCCNSSCGTVCTEAIGLQDDEYLPPIPRILRIKLPRGHKVEITIQSLANSTYYFYIEKRSHVGLLYAQRKFGYWHWQPVEKIAETSDSKSKRTDISFDLKPGHWYQVRVAAINAYGFRGYSEPSKSFKLSNYPKAPQTPVDLRVISSYCDIYYCKVKIFWCPSKSILPIEKYKIIWSLYMKSQEESLITNETYIRDSTKVQINRLKPESSYYIQVQAMSVNGGKRLKSGIISLLHNTTKFGVIKQNQLPAHLKCFGSTNPQTHNGNTRVNSNNNHLSLKTVLNGNHNNVTTLTPAYISHDVHFRYNRKFGMIVQITGLFLNKYKREKAIFELCTKGTNCEHREYNAFRIKKNELEFSNLKYNTTYFLRRTNMIANRDVNDIIVSFTTPKCEQLHRQYTKITFNC